MKGSLPILVALVLASSYIEPSSASTTKTYRDDRLGFEISYLSNWKRSDAPDNPAFLIRRRSDDRPGSISIEIANFGSNQAEVIESLKSNPEALIERAKRRFPDMEMLDEGETFLGGFPAYYLIVNYTIKNLNFAMEVVAMQIICSKGDKVYLVTFETPLVLFETIYDEFYRILATFNFR